MGSEVQALMDAAVDAIILIDAAGQISRCNRAAARLFGYAEAELPGRNVSCLMPEPYRSAHDQYLARYAATGVAHIIGIGREAQGLRKDGSVFPIFLSVGHVTGSEPVRYVGILRDLTAQHQAKAALQSERDRAHAYLELNDAILITLDREGRIQQANQRGCETLGANERDLLGREWLSLIDATDRDNASDLLARTRADSSGGAQTAEVAARAAHGEVRFIAWRCIALRGPDETVNGLLCAGTDVTERRRREDESHLAQDRMMRVSRLATMGEMASSIAHELNQPLTAISNYARACDRYLGMAQPDFGEMHEAVREISAEALRAGDIIRRMRRVVRADGPELVETDVNELISDLGVLMQADARVHDTRLQLALAPNGLRLRVDPNQVQQVILNLLRNALEAVADLPPGAREIGITTSRTEDGKVEIAVTDNGPGVAPPLRESLFEPFATTKGSGRGLGLAISRSIMQAQGGTIGYAAASPTGACFFVRIPTLEV